jgi:hypothetical protein
VSLFLILYQWSTGRERVLLDVTLTVAFCVCDAVSDSVPAEVPETVCVCVSQCPSKRRSLTGLLKCSSCVSDPVALGRVCDDETVPLSDGSVNVEDRD